MGNWLSNFLDDVSEFLAPRKGLIPILGLLMILFNLVVVVFLPDGFLARTNLFLHFGVFLSVLGLMLARAL